MSQVARSGVRVRKLTLADWANIGEVIGAIAVVISLLYVGIQVCEHTEEMRATNRQQRSGGEIQYVESAGPIGL